MSSPSLMFIAGDYSGDQHASPIIRQLLVEFPRAKIWGIGGPSMQAQGFTSLMPFEPFNRMGFLEVVTHLRFFLNAKKYLINQMKLNRPDCLVCVDYPGLNMLLMKAAYKMGIPVVWYIAPMVWAWKKKRASVLGRYASHIGCIFPFEVEYFLPFTRKVSFVGNPLVEAMENDGVSKHQRCFEGEISLAIVPGSRRQEIEKMLPVMVDAYKILKTRFPTLKAKISQCGSLPMHVYHKAIGGTDLQLYSGPLRELLFTSDLALVTSGTATLETALIGVPMVIAYKTSLITYTILKSLVRIPHVGLPNIIAGEKIVPECIQGEAKAEIMAAELQVFIDNRDRYLMAEKKLLALRQTLGSQVPSIMMSEAIMGVIGNSSQTFLNPEMVNNH